MAPERVGPAHQRLPYAPPGWIDLTWPQGGVRLEFAGGETQISVARDHSAAESLVVSATEGAAWASITLPLTDAEAEHLGEGATVRAPLLHSRLGDRDLTLVASVGAGGVGYCLRLTAGEVVSLAIPAESLRQLLSLLAGRGVSA
ncbi:MAG: hypothetical protein NVS4B3_13050 [Gemmatimonadaceae bacterium]